MVYIGKLKHEGAIGASHGGGDSQYFSHGFVDKSSCEVVIYKRGYTKLPKRPHVHPLTKPNTDSRSHVGPPFNAESYILLAPEAHTTSCLSLCTRSPNFGVMVLKLAKDFRV